MPYDIQFEYILFDIGKWEKTLKKTEWHSHEWILRHIAVSPLFSQVASYPSLCITINTSNSCLLYMKNVSGCTSKLQFFFVTNIVFQPYTGTKNRKAGVSFARIKRHTNFANRSACYSGSDKDNAVLTHEVNVRRL